MEKIVKRIQNGETDLLENFVLENKERITKMASKYKDIFKDYEDLVAVAQMHFIKSIYTYNFNKACFLQYVNYRMYTEIQRYVLRNLDRVINFDKKYAICIKVYEKCKAYYNGKEPDLSELARYLCITNSNADELLLIINNVDKSYRYDKNKYLLEYNLDNFVEDSVIKDKILASNLTDKQKEIMMLKYFKVKGKNLINAEIARIYGCRTQNIQIIEKGAIKKLLLKYDKNFNKVPKRGIK